MRAVLRAARGGRGLRRLQSVIIGLVVLAAVTASTVALGLLTNARSAFDSAFTERRGAHVTAVVDTKTATADQVAATTHLTGVSAAGGPFGVVNLTAQVTVPGLSGVRSLPLRIVGRAAPGGTVDDITLIAGHWPRSDQEIVLAGHSPGRFGSTVTVGSRQLSVVGIASSVTDSAEAWVLPSAIAAFKPRQSEMLYRFADAGTEAAVAADIGTLRTSLPYGALLDAVSYLQVRRFAESDVTPWVPFIIAFGVITLAISLLIVVNVVSGAVIAGASRIGVMKAIGFSPMQVVACYVLLAAVPAAIGCVAGGVCGYVLAIPLLNVNAKVYAAGALTVPAWVAVVTPLASLALTVASAVPPALRTGRMSAGQAITAGRAPRPAHGYRAQRALAKLTGVPRVITLGLAMPFARPSRALLTLAAVIFGAAAVTFGTGLAASLRLASPTAQQNALPIRVSVTGGKAMSAAQQRQVASTLIIQPGTLRYLTETDSKISRPGPVSKVNVVAFDGDPMWTGLPLITGRYYSTSPGVAEADVNTLFLQETGTSVGSTYTLSDGVRRTTVRIAGEVFKPGNGLYLYLDRSTLGPSVRAQSYDVALRPGTSPRAYATALSSALGRSYEVSLEGAAGSELVAAIILITMLMILIAAVAGLGVLNTVALEVRERARDIGVLRALGMTPRQTFLMVSCPVAVTGLIADIAALPTGMYLHRVVVPVMARAANTGVPAPLMAVYPTGELLLLALTGLLIAIVGTAGPAGRAARIRAGEALHSE